MDCRLALDQTEGPPLPLPKLSVPARTRWFVSAVFPLPSGASKGAPPPVKGAMKHGARRTSAHFGDELREDRPDAIGRDG